MTERISDFPHTTINDMAILDQISDKIYDGIVTNFYRSKYSVVVSGPPGSPLKFFEPDSENIELSTGIIDQLSTEQQTFFTGASWATFALFYAAASVEGWFNASSVMGDNVKGVAIYNSSTSRSSIIRYSTWWPVTLDIPFSNIDELTQAEVDAMTQAEVDAIPQY